MTSSVFQLEARVLKALAHRKRLEIIHLLHDRELTATEIQRMTGFPQANLSQHIGLLKAAQVVVAVRQGKNIHYRLSHQNFWRISGLLAESRIAHPAQKRETRRSQFQDPVCQMWVEPAATHWQTLFKGATYFFCASGCRQRFLKSPQRYVRT